MSEVLYHLVRSTIENEEVGLTTINQALLGRQPKFLFLLFLFILICVKFILILFICLKIIFSFHLGLLLIIPMCSTDLINNWKSEKDLE